MAKLGAYYGLCPLIDHRSLLGISPDQERGIVIVTLGKNIAIKSKLSDQKQLCSWRTKDRFSSKIIFDKQLSQYVAVFNDNFLRTWNGDEEFLDKLKKLKFNQQIQTIFVCNETSFMVFKNGATVLLKKAVEERKELVLDPVINVNSEYIIDVLYSSLNSIVFVGLVVRSNEDTCLKWTKFAETKEACVFHQIPLHREGKELKGYVFYQDSTSVNLLSLWSDSRIYMQELKEDSMTIGELFTVIESISCKNYVSLLPLDQNYIAIYGCNSNEEGALLVIYSIHFRVVQAQQSFKLFTNGAKLGCVDGNLLFPVGQNLAVAPFYLDVEQLAALIGSHKVEIHPDADVSIVHKVQFANWGPNTNDCEEISASEPLRQRIQEFVMQGISKNMIFESLVDDLLEERNLKDIQEIINCFSDIPEAALVKLLKLILNTNSDLDTNNSLTEKLNLTQDVQQLLDVVLTKSFNESLLLPRLRSTLTLDEVLVLLQYIYFLLSEDGHALPSLSFLESEARLINWSCALLDANYQKFLLTTDDKIRDVLCGFQDHVKEELSCTEDSRTTASLLVQMKNGRFAKPKVHLDDMEYSVEQFSLYQ